MRRPDTAMTVDQTLNLFGRSATIQIAGADRAGLVHLRTISLVLIARRPGPLEAVARRLERDHGVETRALVLDLGSIKPADLEPLLELDVGLLVYNAAAAPRGAFAELPLEQLLNVVDVNVRGPLLMCRWLAPALIARGRGGLVLMSSVAGLRGAPGIAAYSASKAFNTILAEALWSELGPKGIHVVASVAGAMRTPGFVASHPNGSPAGVQEPEVVAKETLDHLARGPRFTSGRTNRLAATAMERLLSRKWAIRLIDNQIKRLT